MSSNASGLSSSLSVSSSVASGNGWGGGLGTPGGSARGGATGEREEWEDPGSGYRVRDAGEDHPLKGLGWSTPPVLTNGQARSNSAGEGVSAADAFEQGWGVSSSTSIEDILKETIDALPEGFGAPPQEYATGPTFGVEAMRDAGAANGGVGEGWYHSNVDNAGTDSSRSGSVSYASSASGDASSLHDLDFSALGLENGYEGPGGAMMGESPYSHSPYATSFHSSQSASPEGGLLSTSSSHPSLSQSAAQQSHYPVAGSASPYAASLHSLSQQSNPNLQRSTSLHSHHSTSQTSNSPSPYATSHSPYNSSLPSAQTQFDAALNSLDQGLPQTDYGFSGVDPEERIASWREDAASVQQFPLPMLEGQYPLPLVESGSGNGYGWGGEMATQGGGGGDAVGWDSTGGGGEFKMEGVEGIEKEYGLGEFEFGSYPAESEGYPAFDATSTLTTSSNFAPTLTSTYDLNGGAPRTRFDHSLDYSLPSSSLSSSHSPSYTSQPFSSGAPAPAATASTEPESPQRISFAPVPSTSSTGNPATIAPSDLSLSLTRTISFAPHQPPSSRDPSLSLDRDRDRTLGLDRDRDRTIGLSMDRDRDLTVRAEERERELAKQREKERKEKERGEKGEKVKNKLGKFLRGMSFGSGSSEKSDRGSPKD
ncbi:hypothetical protein MNV49_005926 [Pseudohyphozyma bogoriensis]|nr:hypothetical protein MNV49_005926 [Pseudohyphozyma bogoriensis]